MKNISGLMALFLAALAAPAFSEPGSAKTSPKPVSFNVLGNTNATYGVTTYPMFGASSSDNEGCANSLRADYSGKLLTPNAQAPQTILAKVLDLNSAGLGGYKKALKILISYTVRIEAEKGATINPWTNNPRLCSPWHGTIESIFPGGDVELMLYINGALKGQKAVMTFPSLGSGSSTNISDPTISNSITLNPADFGGIFPDKLDIKLKWVNKTIGSRVSSPAKYYTMTILAVPSV